MSYVTPKGYSFKKWSSGRFTDLTPYVETIDKLTDVGNTQISTARVMLDAREGEHIIETPKIAPYDEFQLIIEDDKKRFFARWMLADDVQPHENESGRHLIVDLVGRERLLQKMYITGYFPFIKFTDMLLKIRDVFNGYPHGAAPTPSRDNTMRLDQGDFLNVPTHAYGTFDFGDNTTIWDALQEVVKRLSLPVAAGGAGEQYAVLLDEIVSATNYPRTIDVRIVPRGKFIPIRFRDGNDPTAIKSGANYERKPTVGGDVMNLTRTTSPEAGNITIVQGQTGTGSYPRNVSTMRSLIEEYANIPLFESKLGINYVEGAYVRQYYYLVNGERVGFVYRANTAYTGSNTSVDLSSHSSWDSITFKQYVKNYTHGGVAPENPRETRDPLQYSPWTYNKAEHWKKWGGNPLASLSGSGFNRFCFPDSNLSIRDATGRDRPEKFVTVWREWADIKFTSVATFNSISYFGGTVPYDGFRVLVDGRHTAGPFSGSDEFNVPYADSIVQAVNGKWVVLREAKAFDQCAVIAEGKVYSYITTNAKQTHSATSWIYILWNAAIDASTKKPRRPMMGMTWQDMTDAGGFNDCFHYPAEMSNVRGLIGALGDDSVNLEDMPSNSAIRIRYDHLVEAADSDVATAIKAIKPLTLLGTIESLSRIFQWVYDGIFPTDVEPAAGLNTAAAAKLASVDYYNNGWWCTLFESPYPKLRVGSDAVRSLYHPSVFDLNNLNRTPSGKEGYIQEDAEDMGPLDGIAFIFNFDVQGDPLRGTWLGDMPFRITMYDIFGGVWKADISIRFQRESQYIRIPFSSFSSYRARMPIAFAVENAFVRAANPELRETEIYERYFMKRITMQCMLAYDDQGRYDPWKLSSAIYNILPNLQATTIKYIGIIDAFHFTKTPVAIAKGGNSVTRPLVDTIKKYPNVSNVLQLEKIARAENQISRFNRETIEFQIDDRTESVSLCEIHAEQEIILKDETFIPEDNRDIAGTDHTREYIVDKVSYTVGDRTTNSGLVATVLASRRIANP